MLGLLIGPKFNIPQFAKFFVRLNFAFKIFVVKNFHQYFVLKFFREEKFKMRKIFE